jgi:hypothetical protein
VQRHDRNAETRLPGAERGGPDAGGFGQRQYLPRSTRSFQSSWYRHEAGDRHGIDGVPPMTISKGS